MYADLSELSTKEFTLQSGSLVPKTSSVAESSTAHVGHFSSTNVDLGKTLFFRCYVLLPEEREKDVHVKNDLNYWFILLKLMYQMMFVLRCIKEFDVIISITIHTCNAKNKRL